MLGVVVKGGFYQSMHATEKMQATNFAEHLPSIELSVGGDITGVHYRRKRPRIIMLSSR